MSGERVTVSDIARALADFDAERQLAEQRHDDLIRQANEVRRRIASIDTMTAALGHVVQTMHRRAS